MSSTINFVTFNQDYSCLAVGTHNGYRIYSCNPFNKVYSSDDKDKVGDVSIIEMLYSTSLVALVFSPRRLVITNTKVRSEVHSLWSSPIVFGVISGGRVGHGLANLPFDEQRQTTICELTFPTAILAVKLNRKRLVVVLEEQIYVYDISNMKLLHTIETSRNPNGNPPASCVLPCLLTNI